MAIKLICLLTMFSLLACGNSVKEGFVTQKIYHPTYTTREPVYGQMCVVNGKAQSCYQYIMEYREHNHSEKFSFKLKYCPPDGSECRNSEIYVSREVFELYKIEDYFPSGVR